MLETKSVRTSINRKSDGLRILVTRFRGRGLPASRYLSAVQNHGQKFTLRLVKQLATAGRVTLLCHCAEDQAQCHRHLLRRLILSSSA